MPFPPRLTSVFTAALLSLSGAARAQESAQLARELEGVEVVERLGAPAAREAAFLDDGGRQASLAAFPGRPVLLTLNYSSCPMLCSLQLAGLARALKDLPWQPSRQFEVVTISLDPSERVSQAHRAKQVFVRQAGGTPEAEAGWHFLTGPQSSIAAVAESVGFRYRYDPETKEYRHKATLVVLTPDGRVSSYLHGINYPVADLQSALQRAADGTVLSSSEQSGLAGFLMDCIRYNPASRAPLAMLAMRLAGLATLAFLLSVIVGYSVREHRRKSKEGT